MRAAAGDALRVKGHRVGEEDREGMILEVHGEDGAPPYLVRWRDGQETVFFPSCDTMVEHLPSEQRTK
jgi:hypothetical protein